MPALGIRTVILTISVSFAFGPWLAHAEEAIPEIELDTLYRYVTSTDLSALGARVAQSSAQADLSFPLAGAKSWGLVADLIATTNTFHFDHFERLISDTTSPLQHATDVSFQPTLAIMPNVRWTVVLQSDLEYSGATGARFRDSLLASGSLAAVWRQDENLKIGLGFQLYRKLPSSKHLLPFPIIDWRSGPWSLTALDGQSGRLSRKLTDKVSMYGQLEFLSRDIRLSPNSTVASGILHYEAFPAVTGIEFKLNKHVTLSVSSGLTLGQQYRFDDHDGHYLRESDKRSPVCLGFGVDGTF